VAKLSEVEAQSAVIEVLGELTPEEEIERHRLELRVEKTFSEGCFALRLLRDKSFIAALTVVLKLMSKSASA
jgi:hypothetical protein